MIVIAGLGAEPSPGGGEEVGLCMADLSEKAVMQAECPFLAGASGSGQGS